MIAAPALGGASTSTESRREQHMIETRTPVHDRTDHLQGLIDRIATGDRAAFRCLYAFWAVQVWRYAIRILPHPIDARAVTRSTFVEIWHLSRHQVDDTRIDGRIWIAAITARRTNDRLRAGDTPHPLRGEYDRQMHCELAALLGAGHATIRMGPATFTRVDDLDRADLSPATG
jgi:DNA-directed RNA polymerase specialized sigma24 family protein